MADANTTIRQLRALAAHPGSFDPQTIASIAAAAADLISSASQTQVAAASAIPMAAEFMGTRAAVADVVNERVDQVRREGWTHAHDDEHVNGELAIAGALYASPITLTEMVDTIMGPIPRDPWPFADFVKTGHAENGLPIYKQVPSFDNRAKHSRRRRLVIGAALIIAEIERLDRAVEPKLMPANDAGPTLAPA